MPKTKSKKKHKCVKCGKRKPEGEVFKYSGDAYCCKKCCGDPEKGEHKEEADGVCEFC